MNQRLINLIPGVEAEEMLYLDHITKDLTDDQLRAFVSYYASRRKSSDTILICTILGFVVVAGIQRFMLGQVGMGILYLFTGGLCLIGTIVDLVNYKKMTLEYNQKMAAESMALVSVRR